MKKIIGYVVNYFLFVEKRVLILSAFFVGLLVFFNYTFHINDQIRTREATLQYIYWYFVFLAAFSFSYVLAHLFHLHKPFRNKQFLMLLFIAPLLFSWKMVYDIELFNPVASPQNIFWNQVIYWPFKLTVISTALFFIWLISGQKESFYGFTLTNFNYFPYLIMLLLMVPLIAAASTQPDFLQMYPKLNDISFLNNQGNSGLYKLLFELSYGSDFITIELFFRGFLILAFSRWFGKDAILPMACFYCTIHFGKPLGECISSFFGGLVLGILTYHTRTIIGGLMVHLGIAWLMELGGYLGNKFL